MTDSLKKYFLEDKSIFLREQHKDDFPFIYNLVREFLKTDLSVTFLELPNFEKFFKMDMKRYVISNGNELLGFVQIHKGEIGYFVDPKYQGKSIGTNAVKKLMEINPNERYFATINNNNKHSIKLIKKLGFHPKATIYEKVVK